jgi:gamma-glutamylcyclotransferase (GGCT)/AIG2-like uncharacterized protein YtfP
MPEAAALPDPAIDAPSYVFVYGTLRRGDDNDITRLRPAPRWLGNAVIQGTMHHLGAYPGVVLGGAGQVLGEVYAISPALESQLDEIEELYPQRSDEYFKRRIPVNVDGNVLLCLVYEINPRYLPGTRTILSGDWVRDRYA